MRKGQKGCIGKQISFLFLTVFVLFALCACKDKEKDNPQDLRPDPAPRTELVTENAVTEVPVYYTTTDFSNLVPLTIAVNETKECAFVSLTKLLAGAPNDYVETPFPEGVKLKDLYVQEDTVYAEFTSELLTIEKEKAEIGIAAIAASIKSSLPAGINQLALVVDGETLEKLGGEKLPVTVGPINYYPKNRSPKEEDVLLTTYYSDGEAMYLVPVTQKTKGENLPQEAVEALLAGPPAKSGLSNVFWKGTKCNHFTVKDGVATVDFSKEILGYGGGTAFETMMIDSLVYTLTQFEDIVTVQILIDGEKVDSLLEGSDIRSPLAPNRPLNLVQ